MPCNEEVARVGSPEDLTRDEMDIENFLQENEFEFFDNQSDSSHSIVDVSSYPSESSEEVSDSSSETDAEMPTAPAADATQEQRIERRDFPDRPYYCMDDNDVIDFILKTFDASEYYVTFLGRVIADFAAFVAENRTTGVHNNERFSFHLRIRGGKGGFGSLLRSFRVNKSTNQLMMRDLNGRRLASIDEENKLRRHLERAARREQEKRDRRQAKLNKLKSGPPKHQFEDQDYLQRRDEILEKTEDACEAGFAYLKELRKKKKESKSGVANEEKEESDEDCGELYTSLGGRKRKIVAPTAGEAKVESEESEHEDDSDSEENEEVDPETLAALKEYFDNKDKEEGSSSKDGNTAGSSSDSGDVSETLPAQPRKRLDSAPNVDDLPKIEDDTPCDFAPVDLDDFKSAEELELLGLEHLKSGLTERGMKCGGTLSERAARLFSVKGLRPSEYPKALLTPAAKAKLLEEEANSALKKKKKKAKKN